MAQTFQASCTKNWAPIVDGADFSSFGIQLATTETVFVFSGKTAPDAETKDFIRMYMGSTRELAYDLKSDEKVYIKGLDALSDAVRGWKERRA